MRRPLVFVYELKHDLDLYLRDWASGTAMRSLDDIIAFNAAHADRALRFGQDIFLAAAATRGDLSEPEYLSARQMDLRASRTLGLDAYMDRHRLDAVLFPGAAGASIAAKAGYPSVQVPAGFVSGVGDKETPDYPFGVTFTGRAWSEPTLLRLAYAFEQATQRPPPTPGLSGAQLNISIEPSRAIRPVSTVSLGWCCCHRRAELGQYFAVGLGLDLRIGDAVRAVGDPGGAAIAMVDRYDPLKVVELDRGREVVPKGNTPGLEFGGDDRDCRAGNDELAVFAAKAALRHVIVNRRDHPRIDAGQQHRLVIAFRRPSRERQGRRQPRNPCGLQKMAAIEAASGQLAAA